jgi:TonB family protein
MFEKLVESGANSGRKGKRKKFLAAASAAVLASMGTLLVFSLFNQTLAMGDEFGDLTRLVNPTLAPSVEEIPKREPERPAPDRKTSENRVATRVRAIARTDMPPSEAPKTISSEPSRFRSLPQGAFKIDKEDFDPYRGASRMNGRSANAGLESSTYETAAKSEVTEKPKVVSEPPPLPGGQKTKYIGVVNGKATDLPKPIYPEPARALGINGPVKVEVLIDENGVVVSATALEGNALLRRVSVQAARKSKFKPTTVGGRSVKVRGVIIYNFK